jgi:hypothetical protein
MREDRANIFSKVLLFPVVKSTCYLGVSFLYQKGVRVLVFAVLKSPIAISSRFLKRINLKGFQPPEFCSVTKKTQILMKGGGNAKGDCNVSFNHTL